MTTDTTTPAQTMIDFATLDITARAAEGSELMVRHPVTDEELGFSILLAGKDSRAFRRGQEIANKKYIGKKIGKLTQTDLLNRQAEILAHVTLGFPRGNPVLDGQELPFSRENAEKLYKRFPWLAEQADEHQTDRANYLRD
jgi:hypothetical protein